MRLFKYFLDNTFLVNLLTFFIIVVGIVALTSMKRDLHPPFEWNQVSINVYLPGANSKEMEKFVTFPIEEAVRGLAGMESMQSKSSPSQTSITLKYGAGYDKMLDAVEEVRTRVESIRSTLPSDIRYVNVSQVKHDDAFLFQVGFQGIDIRSQQHRQFYFAFEKEVLNVPGIVKIYKSMPNRDIYVEFDPKKLIHNEISTSEVSQVISQGLNFAPIGQARINDEVYAVEVAKTTDSTEDISNLSVRSNLSGNQIKVKDVAKVSYKLADQFEENFLNGEPMAGMWIIKDTLSDAISLKHQVQSIIDKYNAKAPEGVKVVKVEDGPRFIEQQIEVLLTNGLTGFFLVFVILLIFLNWQTAILTALGLPMAYLATFVVLLQLGIKIDLLSIIGLILVVGILVDDAIIISERYNEFLSQGYSPKDAAYKAIKDMVVPVTGGILTTVVAFSPMLLIESEIAYVLMAVPIVVITSLFFSWLECFFILPNHLTHISKKAPSQKRSAFMVKVRQAYERLLVYCLKLRYGILVGLVMIMGLSVYVAANKIQHNFNLDIGRERVSIYGALKESDSVKESVAKMKPLQDFLMSFPKDEIENVGLYVGSIWMDGAMREGKRFVKLIANVNNDEKHPKQLLKRVKTKIEAKLAEFKNKDFERLYVDIDRKSSEEERKQMVKVRVRGGDSVDFEVFEREITKDIVQLASIEEYVPDPTLQQKAWIFVPDPAKVALYDLDTLSVSRQMRSYFTPNEVIETRIRGEKIYVYTEVKGRRQLEFGRLDDFSVLTPRGASVPLSYLGDWKEQTILKTITHEDGLRALDLNFRINEKNSNKTAAQKDIETRLAKFKEKYPSHEFFSKNTSEEEEKNQAWGLKVALVCILAVLMVMSLTLGSVIQPFIVGLPIPFGLIGIIFALYFHDMSLGLMSIIGLVGTVGISVNASIIIMDQLNKLKRVYGAMSKDVIIEACSERLRAIILTTLTTLGGLLPMAYSLGGESGFTQPLAFAMAWGLVFATLLTLFALPALLQVKEDIGGFARRLIKPKRNKKEKLKIIDSVPSKRVGKAPEL